MQTLPTKDLINNLSSIVQENVKLVNSDLLQLDENQLNWRPSKESWNIREVIAHLNSYSIYYQNTIEIKIKNTRFDQPVETFISSPLGRSTWRSVKLGNARNIKRKLRSHRNYNPKINHHLLTGTEIQDFLQFQNELLGLLEQAKKVNLRKIKIAIPFAKFVNLRLGDAFLFHVYHCERHLEQIKTIIQNPKFPK